MYNNIAHSSYLIDKLITNLEAVAKSIQPTLGKKLPHSYLGIEGDLAQTVTHKTNAVAYKILLKTLEEVSNRSSLTPKKKTSIKNSLTIINDKFKSTENAWYRNIPIISWIYHCCKNRLIKKAEAIIGQL